MMDFLDDIKFGILKITDLNFFI